MHTPDDSASSLSVLNSLTSAYQKCLGNAAWVTLKVPRMNAEILSVTAAFGADPFTVAIASLSHAGTNFFVYRFDPNEAGSITLGRCEQFSHTAEPNEELQEDDLVEVLKASDQENRDQIGEDWIFLSNSDNFKQNISWYMYCQCIYCMQNFSHALSYLYGQYPNVNIPRFVIVICFLFLYCLHDLDSLQYSPE
jgi:hypothetical protein